MKNNSLASALRHRLRQSGLVDYSQSVELTDAEILRAYAVCSRCGAELVSARELDRAVEEAKSAESFAVQSEKWLQNHRCGCVRCELRTYLDWPDEVDCWLKRQPVPNLIEVIAADGRHGVLGMRDGSETRLPWFRSPRRRLTRSWLQHDWDGGRINLRAFDIWIDPDDILWDEEE